MKTNIFTFFLLLLAFIAKSQTINVSFNAAAPVGSKFIKTTTDAAVQTTTFNLLQTTTVTVANPPTGLAVTAVYNGNTNRTVTGSTGAFTIPPLAAAEITNYTSYVITITTPGEPPLVYTSVGAPVGGTPNNGGGGGNTAGNYPRNSAIQELGVLFPVIDVADNGLIVRQSSIRNYTYSGDQYTHIFLDQFGNSLMGVIPQGIANRQYIVHVLYLSNQANPSQISYSINQTKGSFNSTLVFNNAGQFSGFSVTSGGGTQPATVTYVWAHQEFPLRSSSTDNIEFEINRNVLNLQNPAISESSIVGKRTIEMSKVFHGSFDVGLINSELSNPVFEYVPSASDPNQNVVKENTPGSRIVATVMATFYTSPIVLLEKYLLGLDIPNYKLTGRNFLDDHKIYERIYPAIGVSLTEKVFKNIFFGANWEVARGASLFVGCHYGEVNTFRTDGNFKFEETVVTESDYNLRRNMKWKTAFAIGANLDLLVVTNLLRR